ncbi:MAG: sigma-70 family RNA polymerase sigma factor [Anaerolineales bacterium]|nr:sigma-70 family RNA polymerase sigma factor [Anaerolineales bacterium]MCL4260851.1 sigma-70 family RNA polymerase sigma factor [Anaerolineales bacterium]
MEPLVNTDMMLIETAQRGDADAFNLLVLKYQDLLYRISLRIVQDECTAEDATQNAFLQAFQKIRSFRGGSFKGWLARVAINASYDELRRLKRHNTFPLEPFTAEGDEIESPAWMSDLSSTPQELTESHELERVLQECIHALIPEYRLIVTLVDIEGMSYDEAARAARVPVGTVKSRLARARMQLRAALRKFESLIPSAYQVEMPFLVNT